MSALYQLSLDDVLLQLPWDKRRLLRGVGVVLSCPNVYERRPKNPIVLKLLSKAATTLRCACAPASSSKPDPESIESNWFM